jgi:hypothetical protein
LRMERMVLIILFFPGQLDSKSSAPLAFVTMPAGRGTIRIKLRTIVSQVRAFDVFDSLAMKILPG